MTVKPARCPLAPAAIPDLANTHATSTIKRIFSFSKRDVIAFAEAIVADVSKADEDTIRLNVLKGSAGFVTGYDAGKPAYRMLGSDEWHADLRTAIDQHVFPG
ncbi:hypothetical protein [Massilia scottii]|uniref:hypothetical protein n=1 Tax=Massilia scottii TaxID=3057166 RepID=UPI0027965687|nr:hypothetical protein [Massilia sp. CCM 9029]MDQ1835487.1 hypothetical protein [Massilia sp. CCM 9029]